jgi:hypothetical protein
MASVHSALDKLISVRHGQQRSSVDITQAISQAQAALASGEAALQTYSTARDSVEVEVPPLRDPATKAWNSVSEAAGKCGLD